MSHAGHAECKPESYACRLVASCRRAVSNAEKEREMRLNFRNLWLASAAAAVALVAEIPLGASSQALPTTGGAPGAASQEQDAIRGLREQDAAAARTAKQLNAGTQHRAALGQ